MSEAGATLSEKVDLNDLEWEDRERVLRLLFSKMNTGNPSNTQAIRKSVKQNAVRNNVLQAISEEGMRQMPESTGRHSDDPDFQEQHIQQLRNNYGNEAFEKYIEETQHAEAEFSQSLAREQKRDEDIYGGGNVDDGEAPLALEYNPHPDM